MDFEELNKAASQEDGPTRIDRALDKFANMMIERLEACKTKNWEQGWTSGDRLVGLPQNINGRPYDKGLPCSCLHDLQASTRQWSLD